MIVTMLCTPGEVEIYRVPADDALEMERKLADRARQIIMGSMLDANLCRGFRSFSVSCYPDDAALGELVAAARESVPR